VGLDNDHVPVTCATQLGEVMIGYLACVHDHVPIHIALTDGYM